MKKVFRPIWFFLVFLLILYASYSSAQTGSIYVTSKPSGANISLDSNPLQLKTDILIENIPTGIHTISVELGEYGKAQKKVEIREDLTATLQFDLQPKEVRKEM